MRRLALLALLGFALLLWSAPAAAEQGCANDDVACWMKLLDRNDVQAMRAAMRLGQLHNADAAPLLIKKLASSDPYLATAALHALIEIGQPAVLALIDATHSTNAAVRRYAVYALGKIGHGDVIDAVALLAKDKDPSVRRQAAVALGSLKDARGLLYLFQLMRDEYVDVRVAAAEAIGQIGDPRAADQLIDYGLCDLSPDVGRASTYALVQLGEPAAVSLIESYDSKPDFARKRILTALGGIGATAGGTVKARITKLCLLVLNRKTENLEVRAVAAYELGALEAQSAVDSLKAVLVEIKPVDTPEAKQLAAACRAALDKIYRRYNLTRDY